MKHFANEDLKTLAEFTPEELSCIVKAWVEGNCERLTSHKDYSWKSKPSSAGLYNNAIYRTKPLREALDAEG